MFWFIEFISRIAPSSLYFCIDCGGDPDDFCMTVEGELDIDNTDLISSTESL